MYIPRLIPVVSVFHLDGGHRIATSPPAPASSTFEFLSAEISSKDFGMPGVWRLWAIQDLEPDFSPPSAPDVLTWIRAEAIVECILKHLKGPEQDAFWHVEIFMTNIPRREAVSDAARMLDLSESELMQLLGSTYGVVTEICLTALGDAPEDVMKASQWAKRTGILPARVRGVLLAGRFSGRWP